jgi:hypothetical protein
LNRPSDAPLAALSGMTGSEVNTISDNRTLRGRMAGGPVGTGEDHEQLMLALGLQPKREMTRTRVRGRTAMTTQTREQGRYLGGRPPYEYLLADAWPHPNKAHAAWGRRAHRPRPHRPRQHWARAAVDATADRGHCVICCSVRDLIAGHLG